MRFQLLWRPRWLTAGAADLEGIAESLERAAGELREMRLCGVRVARRGGYTRYLLETDDQAVAERFGFEPAGDDDEGDDDDDRDA